MNAAHRLRRCLLRLFSFLGAERFFSNPWLDIAWPKKHRSILRLHPASDDPDFGVFLASVWRPIGRQTLFFRKRSENGNGEISLYFLGFSRIVTDGKIFTSQFVISRSPVQVRPVAPTASGFHLKSGSSCFPMGLKTLEKRRKTERRPLLRVWLP